MKKIILLSLLFFGLYNIPVLFEGQPKETVCGVVTFKGTEEMVHKHSTSTEFILVVKVGDHKETHNVDAATWSSYEVGSNICLSVTKSIGARGFLFIAALLFGVTPLWFIFGFSLIWGCAWLFGFNSENFNPYPLLWDWFKTL